MGHRKSIILGIAALSVASVLVSAPATAHTVAVGDTTPSFSESNGCGALGVGTPRAYSAAFGNRGLPSDHVVYGPWGTWFGRDYNEVTSHLVLWTVPMSGGEKRWVHELALPAFQRVTANLAAEQADGNYYNVRHAGTRVWRRIGGSYRMSTHSFGTTIDINGDTNPYIRDPDLPRSRWTDMPQWYVDAWKDAGFCWGGDWITVKDAMHFSWMGPFAGGATSTPSPDHVASAGDFDRTLETADTALGTGGSTHTFLVGDTDRDGASDIIDVIDLNNDHAKATMVVAKREFRACAALTWTLDGVGDNPRFAIGDPDQTAYPDLWSAALEGDNIDLVIHHAESEYRDTDRYTLPISEAPDDLLAADIDADGLADAGIVIGDTVEWFDAASGFESAGVTWDLPSDWSGRVFAGDRDGDLDPNPYIVSGNKLYVVDGSDGSIDETHTISGSYVAAGIGELDGDGRNDLYLLEDDGTLTIEAGGSGLYYRDYWFRTSGTECTGGGDEDNPDSSGDGYPELIVGAPYENIESVKDAGSITVFNGSASGPDRSGSVAVHQDTHNVNGVAETKDYFGAAVEYGDFNGDGYADVVVGSPGEGIGSSPRAGSISEFLGGRDGFNWANDTIWAQSTTGIKGAAEPDDSFGSSLAAGDFDGDGRTDLAVGVPHENLGSASEAGMVNVLYGASGGLTASGDQTIHQGTPGVPGVYEGGDEFGSALAAGDVNDDGFDDLIVGIPGEDLGSRVDTGYVQIFFGSSSGLVTSNPWELRAKDFGVPASETPGARFGASVAAGDFNGDGDDDIAIGAPDAANGAGLGIVVLSTSSGPDLGNAGIVEGSSGGELGTDVATGDFDRDGYDDVAFGAPGTSSSKGAVVLVYGQTDPSSATTKTIKQSTADVAGAAEAGDKFGSFVAFFDFNTDLFHDLIVGVPGEDIGTIANAGAVHYFMGNSGRSLADNETISQSTGGVPGGSETSDGFGWL